MDTIDVRDMTDRAGLSWHLPEGMTVMARIVPDQDTRPEDYGIGDFTPEQIEAWREDRWSYVGLIVTVYGPEGIELGSDSVWGFEYGSFPAEDGESLSRNPLTDSEDTVLEVMDEAISTAAAVLVSMQGRGIRAA